VEIKQNLAWSTKNIEKNLSQNALAEKSISIFIMFIIKLAQGNIVKRKKSKLHMQDTQNIGTALSRKIKGCL